YAGSCGGARAEAIERHEVQGTPHLVALEPLSDLRGEALGCVAVSRSMSAELTQLRLLTGKLLTIGLFITLLAVLAGYFAASRMAKPVASLTTAALRIARGDLSQKQLDSRGRDELGTMARAFNRMLDSLHVIAAAADRMAEGDLRGRIDREGHVADAF